MNIKEKTSAITKFLGMLVFLFAVINITSADKFSEWDENGDNELSISEFKENFSDKHYSLWDVNNDESLDNEDFYKATFRILDKDDDNQLNTAEKEWGYEHLYGDYVDYDVTVKDSDKDTGNFKSFRRSMKKTDYYSDADMNNDSNLDKSELAEAVFTRLDKNDNGTLSSNEFDSFADYFVTT